MINAKKYTSIVAITLFSVLGFSQPKDYCNITITEENKKISENAYILAMDEASEPQETLTKEALIKHASDAWRELEEAKRLHEELRKLIPESYSRHSAHLHASIDKNYEVATKCAKDLNRFLNRKHINKSKIINRALKLHDAVARAEKEHLALETEMKKYFLAIK